MSTYQHKADFISRTRAILSKYEKIEQNYEKTLFLNCCLGLLIVPQQCVDHDNSIIINDIVDYPNWGIDETKITKNELGRGVNLLSVENIAYHIRNSICHYRFDILNQNVETIKTIHIHDQSSNGSSTFDMDLEFSDFKKFILKYAEELEKIIRQNC